MGADPFDLSPMQNWDIYKIRSDDTLNNVKQIGIYWRQVDFESF